VGKWQLQTDKYQLGNADDLFDWRKEDKEKWLFLNISNRSAFKTVVRTLKKTFPIK
jgi:hypothetical protein